MTPAEIAIEVAKKTGADVRSVTKRMAGLPVKGGLGVCIDNELRATGLPGR